MGQHLIHLRKAERAPLRDNESINLVQPVRSKNWIRNGESVGDSVASTHAADGHDDAQSGTDLGFLLRKNPARSQSFSLSFGRAHVFYPEATPERCTVALLVEIDPVGLVRNRRGPAGEGGALEHTSTIALTPLRPF